MQKIKVAEIKGPLGRGEKKFYAVVGSDGAKFTTFDAKAMSIKPGSILEAEIKVEGKYVNMVKWTLLQEPEAGLGDSRETGAYKRDTAGIQFEYQLKARLQQIERASIESQVAYKEIMQLAASGASFGEHIQDFNRLFGQALKWANSRLDESMKPIKPEPKPTTKPAEKPTVQTNSTEVDPEHPFPNIGALLAWCAKQGINRVKFMEIIQVKETDIHKVNTIDAHHAILDYLKQNPKDRKKR